MRLDHGGRRHFVVAVFEVMIAEGLRHDAPQFEDLGGVLAAQHDVTVIQLNVNVGLLVQQVVSAT